MSRLRCLLPLLLILSSLAVLAQDRPIDTTLFLPEDETSTLLKKFLLERRDIPLPCKPRLIISGDVQFEFDEYDERIDKVRIRGSGTCLPDEQFFITATMLTDYRTNKAWAATRIFFKNRGGKVSGTNRALDLDRAYIGYNLYECGTTRWLAEIGRQPLFDRFESEVQYGSRLDGIFTRFCYCFPCLGKFQAQGAVMVIDTLFDQYASIYEIALLDIKCTGWFSKLSYVNWMHNGTVRDPRNPIPSKDADGNPTIAVIQGRDFYAHRVLQLLLGYKYKCFWRDKDLKIYGAYLNNLIARRREITNFTKQNQAGYIGVQLGQIRCCGDWAFKFVYDYVEAQSILESDNKGIGRGNIRGNILNLAPCAAKARGGTNYKGISTELTYALTNDLIVRGMYQRAVSADDNIGGPGLFVRYMIRFIYAF